MKRGKIIATISLGFSLMLTGCSALGMNPSESESEVDQTVWMTINTAQKGNS